MGVESIKSLPTSIRFGISERPLLPAPAIYVAATELRYHKVISANYYTASRSLPPFSSAEHCSK
jgi:hypothetical protein